MRVALIGTGIMGVPMARNIAKAGYDLTVWNRSLEKAAPLAAEGVRVGSTPKDCVKGAESVIFMVTDGAAVDGLLFGENGVDGIAAQLAPGCVVVVMSSIPVDLSRRQSECLTAKHLGYIDAPVSGGERGAIEGALTIMAGGDAAILDRVKPLLETMGRVTHGGPVGCGQLAKLANQMIVGITIGAVAEALLLAQEGGADIEAVRLALIGGFADSTILRQHGERMIHSSFEPGARAAVQLKDLVTAQAQAARCGMVLPHLDISTHQFREMVAHGRANLDHSALYLELADAIRATRGTGQ